MHVKVSLELRALTFSGHKDAILCVSAQEDGTLCATGAGDEIKIWEPRKIGMNLIKFDLLNLISGTVWDRQRDLILPTGTGPEVRVGALCWGHCHGQLFATYLHHGVVCVFSLTVLIHAKAPCFSLDYGTLIMEIFFAV